MLFFTSDTHYNHENILKHTDRGTKDINNMNSLLIEAINSKVGKRDVLYHLGDFALGTRKDVIKFRNSIKCREIHLIAGNHDSQTKRGLPSQWLSSIFTSVSQIVNLRIDGFRFVMCHYPLSSWQGLANGAIHLHGHLHKGGLHKVRLLDGDYHKMPLQAFYRFDVGVDRIDSQGKITPPYSIDEIKEIFKEIPNG